MEYTTSSGAIAMPAHYALVPQDEMVYLEGGALFDISKEQVLQFGVNVVVNGLTLFGGILFSSGVSMLACALIGTTSTTGRVPPFRMQPRLFSSIVESPPALFPGVG